MSSPSIISVEEFNALQQQLVALKQERYEIQERDRKTRLEVEGLRKQCQQFDKELKKANVALSKSKDKQAIVELQTEIDQLNRTIEVINAEHREQNEALRNNMTVLYKNHETISKELLDAKNLKLAEAEKFSQLQAHCNALSAQLDASKADNLSQSSSHKSRLKESQDLITKQKDTIRQLEIELRIRPHQSSVVAPISEETWTQLAQLIQPSDILNLLDSFNTTAATLQQSSCDSTPPSSTTTTSISTDETTAAAANSDESVNPLSFDNHVETSESPVSFSKELVLACTQQLWQQKLSAMREFLISQSSAQSDSTPASSSSTSVEQLEDLYRKLQISEESFSDLQKEKETLNSQSHQLQEQMEDLNRQLQARTDVLKELEESDKKLRQELETSTQSNFTLKSQIEELQTRLKSESQRDEQSNRQFSELHETYRKKMDEFNTDVEHSKQLHREEISQLEKQIETLKENHRLKQTSAQQAEQRMQEDAKQMQEKVLQMELALEDAGAKNDELEHQFKQKEHDLESQIRQREQQLRNVRDELNVSRDDRENLIKAISQKEQQINALTLDLEAKNKQISSLMKEIESKGKETRELHDHLAQAKMKIAELTAGRDKFGARVQELEKHLKDIQPVIDKGRLYDGIYKELQVESDKRSDLDSEFATLKTKFSQAQSDILMLDESARQATESFEREHARFIGLKHDLEATETQKRQLHDQAQQLRADLNDREVRHQSVLGSLELRCERLQSLLDENEQEVLRLWSDQLVARVAEEWEAKELSSTKEELRALRKRYAALEEAKVEFENRANDLDAELRVNEKKAQNMVRELKTQLKKERAHREKLEMVAVGRSTTASGSDTARPPPSPMSTSSRISFDAERNAGGGPISGNNSNSSSHVPRTPRALERSYSMSSDMTSSSDLDMDSLIHENNVLLQRIGELQTSKWQLEEKVRRAEDSAAALHDDLSKKSQIIKYYMHREKTGGLVSPESDKFRLEQQHKKSTLMGTLFSGKGGTSSVSWEIYAQMQKLTEETILRNIQLQKDLNTLGDEVTRLMDDNQVLKAQLPSGSSSPPVPPDSQPSSSSPSAIV